jgi:opacity protein-like surface antigen
MKKQILLILLFFLSGSLFSQNLNGRFSSAVYMFERFDSSNVSQNHIRAYQMLNLNFNYKNFSLRSNLNLETDFAQKLVDDPRLRFYSLYLEARDVLDIANIKIGRQPIINSVVGGLMDGASISLSKYDFKLSGFYGGNVPAYQKLELIENFSDNFIAGARLSTSILENFNFAVGYLNKNFKPIDYKALRLDPNLNPIQVLISNKSNQFQYLSGEASYFSENFLFINSRYEYDLNFKQTSKVEFDARIEKVKDLGVNLYYNYREPRIRYNSIFSVFDYGNTQEIEAGLDYKIDNNYTLLAQFGYVKFKDDNSSRLGVGASTKYGTINYRKTFGYAGEMDAISLYSAYTFLDGFITPNIGLSYSSFKVSKDSETNNITTLVAGLNFRPFRKLSFDLQGQYLDNKIYKNDFRLFLKLNHWFNLNF